MARTPPPENPRSGRGQRLWDEITAEHDLDASQRIVLEEASRCADRLDQLDNIIGGKGVLQLMHFRHMFDQDSDDERQLVMTCDSVLAEARQQQTVLKQLLAALRLPDAQSGKKPQQRGGARGSYRPSGATPKVSSLDRKRAAKSG